VAFNLTFEEFGLDVHWDEDYYHQLLQVGGGKERMRHHYERHGFGKPVEDLDELIRRMHKRKTDVFIGLIEGGKLPLRPGVHRLMREARDAGLRLGVCTTSNERSAAAITGGLLSDIPFNFILAGDVVDKKKPDPEIYLMALEKSGLKPEECVVVEDSHIGTQAAMAAGCRVLATVNGYTRQEDMSAADLVVSNLGEPGEPAELLKQPSFGARHWEFGGMITLESLRRLYA
jgi:HAD superfamily hydrolase (TIGR01509 family)